MAHGYALVRAWPDRERFGARYHSVEQRIVDLVDRDDAAGAGAGLSRQSERAFDDERRSSVEVGVGKHDDGVLSAHLQLHATFGADARWIALPTEVEPVNVTAATRSSPTTAAPALPSP